MQHLLSKWPKISEKLINRHVCVFLDYDGTLTPIANKPKQALLSQETKNILKKLTEIPKCHVSIISGRSLKNIKDLVGLKNIIYSGNHGLEFGDLNSSFRIPVPSEYTNILQQIKNMLKADLAKIKGALIEDKEFSITLHYRSVNKKNVDIVKNSFNRITGPYKAQKQLIVMAGKKILEILPPIEWNKSKMVLLILRLLRIIVKQNKIMAFYIGDDLTDENAFKALKNKGITVFVGKTQRTQANYYLKNTQEVIVLLEKINSLLTNDVELL